LVVVSRRRRKERSQGVEERRKRELMELRAGIGFAGEEHGLGRVGDAFG
jgi:hypothetical protein